MKITDDIVYVGVNDHDIDLFEGQFEVPLGMAYNSYVVKGEKVAVMDTVDARFGDEWLRNVAAATDRVDYLVVHPTSRSLRQHTRGRRSSRPCPRSR